MKTRTEFSFIGLCLVSAFLCLCRATLAQTDDPFSIRVESNLVLVHVEVYDDRFMNTASRAALDCQSANTGKFYSLPLSEPFIPKDCLHGMVIDDLGVRDFRLFEDGVEQKIESVRYEREAIFTTRDNLGVHSVWSHTPDGKWSSVDLGSDWRPAQALHFYRLAYIPTKLEEHAERLRSETPGVRPCENT